MTEHDNQGMLSKFGSAVKTLRHQRGISQEELAGRSGLHRTYVTDVERGVRNVSLDSITKLARALEVPLTGLFAEVEKLGLDYGTLERRRFSGKPVEILLIEDNAKHVELTLHALEKNGMANVVTALSNGEDALDFLFVEGKYAHRPAPRMPNLVLLDLNLPKLSGLEVLRKIRADERTRTLPVVILTSSRSDRDYHESVKLGVTAYISKPVDFLEFSTIMPKVGFMWQLVEHL